MSDESRGFGLRWGSGEVRSEGLVGLAFSKPNEGCGELWRLGERELHHCGDVGLGDYITCIR